MRTPTAPTGATNECSCLRDQSIRAAVAGNLTAAACTSCGRETESFYIFLHFLPLNTIHQLDPKMEPRRSQAGAKTEPSWIQDGQRRSQAGAKMEPIWAKMEPRGGKMEPRWAKIGPRWAKMEPRWAGQSVV